MTEAANRLTMPHAEMLAILRRKHDEADLLCIADMVDWLEMLLDIYGDDAGVERCLAEARERLARR